MDDEADLSHDVTREDALDRLGGDLGIVTDRAGQVLAVTGPVLAYFAGSVVVGVEFIDLVHVDDRAAVLTMLTGSRGQASSITLRVRHAQRWWKSVRVESLVISNEEVVLVGRDDTITVRSEANLAAYEAILGVANDDVQFGVAVDAVARAAQAAVPGAKAAVYVRRGEEFELAAAPNLDANWTRRAFRFAAHEFVDENNDVVHSVQRPLAELAAEFRLGTGWLIAPTPSPYEAATIAVCLFVGEKRFVSRDEQTALEVVSDLLALTQRSEARRMSARENLRNDELTGVATRRTVLRDLIRNNNSMTVALVSVTGLHALNQEHGFEVGDAVLLAVAGALRSATRRRDQLGRFTGSTFIIYGSGRDSRDGRDHDQSWVARITAAVAGPMVAAGVVIEPRCTVIEVQREPDESNRELLQRAEAEVRKAKSQTVLSAALGLVAAGISPVDTERVEPQNASSEIRHSGSVENDR